MYQFFSVYSSSIPTTLPKTPNRSENSFKRYEFLIFHVSFLYGQLSNLYGNLYGKTNDAKCHHWTQGIHRFFFIQIKKYKNLNFDFFCENVENCSHNLSVLLKSLEQRWNAGIVTIKKMNLTVFLFISSSKPCWQLHKVSQINKY